jgi:hypothetical protein
MRVRFSVSRAALLVTLAVAATPTMAVAALEPGAGPGAGPRAGLAPRQKPADQGKKPSISLRANPPVGFSPLRVVLTVEIKGGANDYEDFYCASVEWDWGDDTRSESKADCDPYEAGKSEIKRRFVQEHTFRSLANDLTGAPGQPTGPTQFRVRFVLKQKNKVVGTGQTVVEIRSGAGGESFK